MDEQNHGNSIIFDYNAMVSVERKAADSLAFITLDIPIKRVESRKREKDYFLSLSLYAEIVDRRGMLLIRMEEPHTQTLSFAQLKNMTSNDMFIHKKWSLALPSNGRYIYISVMDNNKGKRLRKLLQITK